MRSILTGALAASLMCASTISLAQTSGDASAQTGATQSASVTDDDDDDDDRTIFWFLGGAAIVILLIILLTGDDDDDEELPATP